MNSSALPSLSIPAEAHEIRRELPGTRRPVRAEIGRRPRSTISSCNHVHAVAIRQAAAGLLRRPAGSDDAVRTAASSSVRGRLVPRRQPTQTRGGSVSLSKCLCAPRAAINASAPAWAEFSTKRPGANSSGPSAGPRSAVQDHESRIELGAGSNGLLSVVCSDCGMPERVEEFDQRVRGVAVVIRDDDFDWRWHGKGSSLWLLD